eukprot:1414202-Prymnesium_polylepis.1
MGRRRRVWRDLTGSIGSQRGRVAQSPPACTRTAQTGAGRRATCAAAPPREAGPRRAHGPRPAGLPPPPTQRVRWGRARRCGRWRPRATRAAAAARRRNSLVTRRRARRRRRSALRRGTRRRACCDSTCAGRPKRRPPCARKQARG